MIPKAPRSTASRALAVLALAFLSVLPLEASASPDVLKRFSQRGADDLFAYEVEDAAVVGWADPKFEENLLGDVVYVGVKKEGQEEEVLEEVVKSLRVGPLHPDEDPEVTARWMEKLEVTAEVTPGKKARTLEVSLSVRNTTDELIAFRKNPLAIRLGPLGSAAKTSSMVPTSRAKVGNSLVTVTPGEAIDEDARYVSFENGFHVYVMELVEGPGRFLLEERTFYTDQTREAPIQGRLLALRPTKEIHGNERFTVRLRLFTGLKAEATLQAAGYPELFDLWSGWTGPIAQLMFWFLKIFFDLTKNWGLAIVLLTLFVKILLHPISKKQYESMAKMQKLQPEIQRIQVQYQNNQQRAQQEIQKLMVESGANPLLGCLPLLMQIPVFFALYSCLTYAPELRGASFLWLTDLSLPDPYLILPLMFSGGIYLSASQGNQDPNSKMMMQIMPVMMFVFMINISSGVMIYLAGQTILGFFEQRAHRSGDDPKAGGAKAAADGPVVVENQAPDEPRTTGNKYKQSKRSKSK